MANLVDKINEKHIRKDIPEFRVGDTVRVDVWVKEGKKDTLREIAIKMLKKNLTEKEITEITGISKKELNEKVESIRSLKALKEELENELKAIENEVISYMTENGLDTEITDTAKITYKPQSRTTLDKEKLSEILGEDLKPFEKTTSFKVLRIK